MLEWAKESRPASREPSQLEGLFRNRLSADTMRQGNTGLFFWEQLMARQQ
jgi:hypothetical protein